MNRGRPLELPEPWLTLARWHGGRAELAKLVGVSPTTIYRIAHGATPSRPVQMLLAMVAQQCMHARAMRTELSYRAELYAITNCTIYSGGRNTLQVPAGGVAEGT